MPQWVNALPDLRDATVSRQHALYWRDRERLDKLAPNVPFVATSSMVSSASCLSRIWSA